MDWIVYVNIISMGIILTEPLSYPRLYLMVGSTAYLSNVGQDIRIWNQKLDLSQESTWLEWTNTLELYVRFIVRLHCNSGL